MTDDDVLPTFESMMKSKKFNSHAGNNNAYQRYDYENNPASASHEKAKLKEKANKHKVKTETESEDTPNKKNKIPREIERKHNSDKQTKSSAVFGKIPSKDELDKENTLETPQQKATRETSERYDDSKFKYSIPSFKDMMDEYAFIKVGTVQTRTRYGKPLSNKGVIATASEDANAKREGNIGTDNLYADALGPVKRGRQFLGGAWARQAPRRSDRLDPTMTAGYIAKLKANGYRGNLLSADGKTRKKDVLGRGYTFDDHDIRPDEMTTSWRDTNREDWELYNKFTRMYPGLVESYLYAEDPKEEADAEKIMRKQWEAFKIQNEKDRFSRFANDIRERHGDDLGKWMSEKYPAIDVSESVPDEYALEFASQKNGEYESKLDKFEEAYTKIVADNPTMDSKEAIQLARKAAGMDEVTWLDKWRRGYDKSAEKQAQMDQDIEDRDNEQWVRDRDAFAAKLAAEYHKKMGDSGDIPEDVIAKFETDAKSELKSSDIPPADYEAAKQRLVRIKMDQYRQDYAGTLGLPINIQNKIYGYDEKDSNGNIVHIPGEAEKMADEEMKKRATKHQENLQAVETTRKNLDKQHKIQEDASEQIDTIDRNMGMAADTDSRLKTKLKNDDSDRAADLQMLMELKGGNKNWIRDRFDDKSSELEKLRDLATKYSGAPELKDVFTDDWITGSKGMANNWKFSKPLNKLVSHLNKPTDAQDMSDAQAASRAQSEYDKTQHAKRQLGDKVKDVVKYEGKEVGQITRPTTDKDIIDRKNANEEEKGNKKKIKHDEYESKKQESGNTENSTENKTEDVAKSMNRPFGEMLDETFRKNHGPTNYPPMTEAQMMRDPYRHVNMVGSESKPIDVLNIYNPEVITNGEGISVKNAKDVGPSIRKSELPSMADMMASPETNWFAKSPESESVEGVQDPNISLEGGEHQIPKAALEDLKTSNDDGN